MDLRPIIARMVADCDLRNRFLKQFPRLLDSYELTKDGQIITSEPRVKAERKNFLDGFSFIHSKV